ncbi:DEAD/DEAH box helicase [Cryptosporangium arvum]|uniref:DNA/RNA helicase, superfamily II n=1 Tax=Cryptosporangium arvum DSM 44712 TaxID=927661 RepID=A0A010ZNX6_9ACTN|nr:DEAD/DEAH box helicase [Cryptosporangium arvum]EXG80389.1 DNA/RNA helicase, superfamily II [Cryptosporangium arvum DSM 44712]
MLSAEQSHSPARTFLDLGVPAVVVDALAADGVHTPFPIQTATLPDTLAGRDVLGRGRTGSGKTLAFVLPVVSRLATAKAPRRAGRPRGLVLVPTRELATQVHAVLRPLADAARLTTTTVFGGVGLGKQISVLAGGIDVLVACPGRLEELIRMGHCDLGGVEITVLDEADHMADLGFLPSVKRLLDRTPTNGQRLLFSATLDNGVDVLVRRYLHQPVTHSVDPAVAPVATMEHHVFQVASDTKADVVRQLASGRDRSLLFTRTKSGARRLARSLTAAGVPAVDLHGNLAQNARERNLAAFTSGAVKVLVATDIAARGVHVDDVALVVHVDPPAEHKAFLHRSGRTARAGASGVVVTIATPDQQSDVRALARRAGIAPKTVAVRPGAAEIVELTGPPAEPVTPQAPAQTATAGRGRGGAATDSRGGRAGESPAGAGRSRRGSGGRGAGRGATHEAPVAAGQRRTAPAQRDGAAPAGRSSAGGRGGAAHGGRGATGENGGRGGANGRSRSGAGRSGGSVYTSDSNGASGYTAGGAAAHSERGGGRRRRGSGPRRVA